MPNLDARLQAVLHLIQADVHADIGSDHAHLPIRLAQLGRITRGVIVEVNPGPLEHARVNVARAGLTDRLEVRAGDGLAPLAPGEVQSASMTGMGAQTMLGILTRTPDRVPDALVLQPNDSPEPLRRWAQARGYHVTAEVLTPGFWRYPVLRLERQSGPDPAYVGLPAGAALRYGPHLLREGSPLLREQVAADVTRLTPLAAPGRAATHELEVAQSAAVWLSRDRK
ncbi:tRNA (adenine-N(1))-methyltransferase [Deinococcus arenae]|uniref:tRNA (Adenine-N(1))-methyltransferase n=1 Tax=Deinococcus arenae TaxID=1452751 RepID=A0A8H9GQV7_9DEIO|nr:tRNA (adenine(22)-N(1))-methyltransferase TrmK [Deinococcus arenae]AWT34123.1 tRNA (adenine-N(1))-methyltransferase [Deinococcus actinosclerus]GGM50343.1 tRNA (adenine-N(1))-methyltransferase [Deinococcus arenae]